MLVGTPMPKSVSFLRKGNNSTVGGVVFCVPFVGGIARYL